MTDFDTVLERLLTDPGFAARLAADPQATLAGYQLSADEADLLRAQVSSDTGGHHQVEQRTSKASLFGLLSPLGGIGSTLGEAASTAGPGGPSYGLGAAEPTQAIGVSGGSHALSEGLPGAEEFARAGFAEANQGGDSAGFGAAADVPRGGPLASNLGAVAGDVAGNLSAPSGESGVEAALPPVENYRTRVDADGDGRWDEHVYVGRRDGGVDIVVDANHDGRVDFIGHDIDRDGLIDEASTDADRDGRLDTRWVDVNGDGWLDRRIAMPPAEQGLGIGDSVDPAAEQGVARGRATVPGQVYTSGQATAGGDAAQAGGSGGAGSGSVAGQSRDGEHGLGEA